MNKDRKINLKNINIRKTLVAVSIIFIATLVACGLDQVKISGYNILLIYLIGVIIIIEENRDFLWGVISAIVCIGIFSFLILEPRMALKISDTQTYITLGIFLIIAVIVSSLAVRLNREIVYSQEKQKSTEKLYYIGRGYLNISDKESLIRYSEENLTDLLNKNCKMYFTIPEREENEAVWWCYNNSAVCGYNEGYLFNLKSKYIPVKSGRKTLGVLEVQLKGTDLTEEEHMYISTIINQTAIALERENFKEDDSTLKLEVEREKIKGNLLENISRDLQRPLKEIDNKTRQLKANCDTIDAEKLNREELKKLSESLNTNVSWLNKVVENLLRMTRIQNGTMEVVKKEENVESLVMEAVAECKKIEGVHRFSDYERDKINVSLSGEIETVPMDRKLILQVLINLIENAMKHTNPGTEINVSTKKLMDYYVAFEVEDNGGGIDEELIDDIFESFVSRDPSNGMYRGMGLGLSISRAIIEEHGGRLTCKNNDKGGATFTFVLPLK